MASATVRLAVYALVLAAAPAAAKTLRVVATTPDLADVVKRIGGDRVSVDTIAKGPEDIHQVVMRPSFVTKLNRADAVVYYGLTLEHSFLPGLLDVAANPKIRMDWTQTCIGTGCIDCSRGLEPLQKPASVSRDQGDLHPMGNPHYNLGPQNARLIAKNVAEGLTRVDPPGAAAYAKAHKALDAELAAKLTEWKALAAPLKGTKVVSYHQDIAYLAEFLGLEIEGTIELKPGIAPTPTHLEKLVETMREKKVRVIIQEQQYERRTADWLVDKTGAKVAVIGTLGNWTKGTQSFEAFVERNLRAIAEAAAP